MIADVNKVKSGNRIDLFDFGDKSCPSVCWFPILPRKGFHQPIGRFGFQPPNSVPKVHVYGGTAIKNGSMHDKNAWKDEFRSI